MATKKLKLFRIEASTKGWDVYTGAVVAAVDEEEARHTHPDKSGDKLWSDVKEDWVDKERGWGSLGDWAKPSEVAVTEIGIAGKDIKKGVILSSFRAG